MDSGAPTTATAKRLWHILRAVFVMLREGFAKSRLFSDLRLHLLFRQGKLAGKSLRTILSDLSHPHHSSLHGGGGATRAAAAAFSCRFMDPDEAIFTPHEVELSCSNTPFHAPARRRRRRHGSYDAAAVARAFEILDSVPDDGEIMEEMPTPMLSVLATPAATVRQLRVSDSPFPLKEKEDTDEAGDREAEEFIRRFYEQLHRQKARAW